MGCRGSKTVVVREASSAAQQPCSSKHNEAYETDSNRNNINIFVNAPDGDAERETLCDNAKPRLTRSAIRRKQQSDDIRPAVNEDTPRTAIEKEDAHEYNVISSTGHNNNVGLLADLSRASDSGFGTTSALSTDRSKSSTANTPHKNLRTRTPNFGIKPPDSATRPDSGKTGSILTTNALNASFMTTGDDDLSINVDVSLDLHTPYSEYTDAEDTTFRTLSITPSVQNRTSVDPTPVMHPKHIGVIKEESEGGFTPRSNDFLDERKTQTTHDNCVPNGNIDGLPQYLPREVLSHNAKAGYKGWTVYKNNVYDTNLIISRFEPLVEEYLTFKLLERDRLEEKKQETQTKSRINGLAKEEDDSDDEGSIEDDYCYDEGENDEYYNNERCIRFAEKFTKRQEWNSSGMEVLLRLQLDSDVIYTNLLPCLIGEMARPFSARYWDDVRGDVRMMLDHLNRSDAKDELSTNEAELKEQFQGWLQQYRSHNPETECAPEGGDPNKYSFPLPARIQRDLSALRLWMESWVEFDLEVPDSGAWERYEIDEVDLDNPDEIFKATLRPEADLLSPFDLEVDGEAAWCVLPSNVVADGVMTPGQQMVEESRRYRTDLHDPKRMERRRHRLLNYFMRKYEMPASKVEHFNRWASAMEEGERQFQALCGNI